MLVYLIFGIIHNIDPQLDVYVGIYSATFLRETKPKCIQLGKPVAYFIAHLFLNCLNITYIYKLFWAREQPWIFGHSFFEGMRTVFAQEIINHKKYKVVAS